MHLAKGAPAPIRLPGSPFWNIFKRFGQDELVALGVSIFGTLVVGIFTTSAFLLALVGPVIEKFGFFLTHAWEAYKLYRATAQEARGSLWSYVQSAIAGGSLSLFEDIVVHDPVYVFLFWLMLSRYPGIPAAFVAGASFIIAVAIVAAGELSVTELKYLNLRRKLRAAGFQVDSYREARFFISSGKHADEILEKLQAGLSMRVVETLRYKDRYFRTKSPAFSGRSPVLRLRQRTAGKSSEQYNALEGVARQGYRQSLQLVYTLAQEEPSHLLEQFRFFSVFKQKFYYPLDGEMPTSLDSIPASAKALIRAGSEYKSLEFDRTILLDPTNTLYIGIDRKHEGEDGCVIELKIRKGTSLLLAAMRFLMQEFPVTQTTMQKTEIALF